MYLLLKIDPERERERERNKWDLGEWVAEDKKGRERVRGQMGVSMKAVWRGRTDNFSDKRKQLSYPQKYLMVLSSPLMLLLHIRREKERERGPLFLIFFLSFISLFFYNTSISFGLVFGFLSLSLFFKFIF